MKTMMSSAIILLSISILFSGCAIFQPNPDITIEQKEEVVYNAAKSATFFAIREYYDDDVDKQNERAQWFIDQMDENIWPILNDVNSTLDSTTEKLLMEKIPVEWRPLMHTAFAVFRMYYRTPNVGEILSGDNYRLLVALFTGINDGCEMVLEVNQENVEAFIEGVNWALSDNETTYLLRQELHNMMER